MIKALITGITGQDGSYLAEFLLEKGYEVHGIIRRSSSPNTERIDHLLAPARDKESPLSIYREYGDLADGTNLIRILDRVQPDEIYNLGAQSHVRISFDIPEYTANTVGLGALRLLEAIRITGLPTKFYQASSSELFGKVDEVPQTESTPFYPRSPYACAKVFAYWTTVNFRESYGLYACNGILFNHESPRRGITFVTRKITRAMARIKLGLQDCLYLGNLDAKRDWGYAKDFVEGMWLILQQDEADDYLLATGETHSVREFVEECGANLGLDMAWEGSGLEERGINTRTGNTIVRVDPFFFRPTEVDALQGDYSKAREKLGWAPKVTFKELVEIMTEVDLKNETDNAGREGYDNDI